jgi:hypothetical protein
MRRSKALDGIGKVIAFERDTLIIITCTSPFYLSRILAQFDLKFSCEGRSDTRQAAFRKAVTLRSSHNRSNNVTPRTSHKTSTSP